MLDLALDRADQDGSGLNVASNPCRSADCRRGRWLLLWFTAPVALALPGSPRAPDLANGQEVFNAGGCSSCHAVPNQPDRLQPDRLRLGGGLAISSPFGTFYAPNISPDMTDGIGRWSEADFINAVMKGVSPQGYHYFPAFPYTSYQSAKVEDISDLFAYLKTLPAVSGKVRSHDLPFPFNIRRRHLEVVVHGQQAICAGRRTIAAMEWRRLPREQFPGHCAECHSPRNFLGGIVASQRFAGGPNLEGEGWVPNITQKGIGKWSEKEIADFLETGEMPEGDTASGLMRSVIKNLSQLTATDRAAMAEYLKSLPPVVGPTPPKRKEGG